ncbi:MAG: hypothetical protein PHU85_09275 [Phycisphaerae bacterium]|nr:hypothetical protein [Phycisphaerae bacterium]
MSKRQAMKTQATLFDGKTPPKQMYHVTVVPDPFAATTQPKGIAKVLRGGPPGPDNTTCANKCTFVNSDGFFKMPPSAEARLHLFVAVVGLRDLKIEVLAQRPDGKQVFRVTLPTERAWQEVVVPLNPGTFKAGAAVGDITVFQLGQDASAELYVRSVNARTY